MIKLWIAVVFSCFCSVVLADAQGDYDVLFGREEAKVAAGRNANDAAAFAAKLLNAAKATGDQKDLQALLCEKAYEFGVKNISSFPTAIDAMKLLAQAVPNKKDQAQEKLLEVAQLSFARSSGAERKRMGEELVGLLVECADGQSAAKPAEAMALYRRALGVATAVGSDRTREIMDKIRRSGSALDAERRLAAMRAAVEAHPKDVRARTNLILAYLGEFDNPVEAAKLVTADLDERLRTYVSLSVKPVGGLDEGVCLELAYWYAELAEKTTPAGRGILFGRAKACCERYLEVHTAQDAARLKGTMLLEKVSKEATPVVGPVGAGLAKTLTLDLEKGVSMKLILIPSGKFLMGSPDDEKGRDPREGPQREVTISKPFYMGVYEVTQEQYVAVMGANPSEFKSRGGAVEKVLWNDAVEFCKRLSAKTAKTGKTVRLPTEAEWEYACRAGTKTRFSFGDDDADLHKYGNYADRTCSDPHQGKKDVDHSDGHDRTAPVGSFKPNAFELYDMHGNVWEWCNDRFVDSYANAETVDPTGPDSGNSRVLRGGSWNISPASCRSAYRHGIAPDRRASGVGFRVSVDSE